MDSNQNVPKGHKQTHKNAPFVKISLPRRGQFVLSPFFLPHFSLHSSVYKSKSFRPDQIFSSYSFVRTGRPRTPERSSHQNSERGEELVAAAHLVRSADFLPPHSSALLSPGAALPTRAPLHLTLTFTRAAAAACVIYFSLTLINKTALALALLNTLTTLSARTVTSNN